MLCGAPDADVLTEIRAGQRPDGGWNFLGSPDDDPFPADSDVDTTTSALHAILAGGAAWNDPAVLAGLGVPLGPVRPDDRRVQGLRLRRPQRHGDRDVRDHRRRLRPQARTAGASPSIRRLPAPRTSTPRAYLRSLQQPDGEIVGPISNTFATTQSVEALLLSWLPLTRATGAPDCAATPTPTPTPRRRRRVAGHRRRSPNAVVVSPNFTG